MKLRDVTLPFSELENVHVCVVAGGGGGGDGDGAGDGDGEGDADGLGDGELTGVEDTGSDSADARVVAPTPLLPVTTK